MEFEKKDITIEEIINYKEEDFLKVNHEYQRAPVWTKSRKNC
jgi:hypothetical protein